MSFCSPSPTALRRFEFIWLCCGCAEHLLITSSRAGMVISRQSQGHESDCRFTEEANASCKCFPAKPRANFFQEDVPAAKKVQKMCCRGHLEQLGDFLCCLSRLLNAYCYSAVWFVLDKESPPCQANRLSLQGVWISLWMCVSELQTHRFPFHWNWVNTGIHSKSRNVTHDRSYTGRNYCCRFKEYWCLHVQWLWCLSCLLLWALWSPCLSIIT